MSRDGQPYHYQLGGFIYPFRCYTCHIAVTVLPLPEGTANPFREGSPGAQTRSYEEWEMQQPDWIPEFEY